MPKEDEDRIWADFWARVREPVPSRVHAVDPNTIDLHESSVGLSSHTHVIHDVWPLDKKNRMGKHIDVYHRRED